MRFVLKSPTTQDAIAEHSNAIDAMAYLVQIAPPYGDTPVSFWVDGTWLFTVGIERTQFETGTYFILLKILFAMARSMRKVKEESDVEINALY